MKKVFTLILCLYLSQSTLKFLPLKGIEETKNKLATEQLLNTMFIPFECEVFLNFASVDDKITFQFFEIFCPFLEIKKKFRLLPNQA